MENIQMSTVSMDFSFLQDFGTLEQLRQYCFQHQLAEIAHKKVPGGTKTFYNCSERVYFKCPASAYAYFSDVSNCRGFSLFIGQQHCHSEELKPICAEAKDLVRRALEAGLKPPDVQRKLTAELGDRPDLILPTPDQLVSLINRERRKMGLTPTPSKRGRPRKTDVPVAEVVKSECPQEDHDIFGILITNGLGRMNDQHRMMAQMEIHQVLHKYQMAEMQTSEANNSNSFH